MIKRILFIMCFVCITCFTLFCQTTMDDTVISVGPRYFPNLVTGGNMWTITFYNDASPNHDQWATQRICFRFVGRVGTQDRYIWYSITFPNWNGWATQEGDEIVMHGDYANNVGHDGMEFEIVTVSKRNEGTGQWWEWRENNGYGRTIGFGNAKFVRIGACRICEEEAAQIYQLPLDSSGNYIEDPMGVSGEDK